MKKLNILFEEINASDAYRAFDSMMTVIQGKRSVAFLLGPEIKEYFNEYIKNNPKLKLMKVKRDGVGLYGDAYILYTDGAKAQKLYKVLMKHEGYLSDDTPEEAIENGEALEYKAEDIKEFVDSHYGEGSYDNVKNGMKKTLKITEAQYNRMKENLIKETRFSWDGTYANESIGDDIELPLEEEDIEDYHYPFDNPESDEEFDPYKLKEMTIGLGDDLEYVDEECGCPLNQPEPTDVKDSQWFSKEDGERTIDNIYN